MACVFFKKDRNKTEFFETSEGVALQLIDLLPKNIKINSILDPCAGSGILGHTLQRLYPTATLTMFDIEPKAEDVINCNFLESNITGHYDVAIINPPFSLTAEFLSKCLQVADHILLISPYRYLKMLHIEKMKITYELLDNFKIMTKVFFSYISSATCHYGTLNAVQLKEQAVNTLVGPFDIDKLRVVVVEKDDALPKELYGKKALVCSIIMGGNIRKEAQQKYKVIDDGAFERATSATFNGKYYKKGERVGRVLIFGNEEDGRKLLRKIILKGSSLIYIPTAIKNEGCKEKIK